ncbi:MAG: LON peptidase substrate-binding domain-containing protein [Ktedonobacterales bacterium]
MADELFEVPLFPLNFVLFPGMALPLHIFEARYRKMTADCLADQAPFGVVLALPEGEIGQEQPARVGTLARIIDYEQLPNGCYNILTAGTRRFEIVELRHEKKYITALVRPYPDEPDEEEGKAELPALVSEAKEVLREYLEVVLALVGGGEERSIQIPDDADDLSYLIGMCLTCEDCDKQELLEMNSVSERLQRGIRTLRNEMELLREQAESVGRVQPDDDRAMLN